MFDYKACITSGNIDSGGEKKKEEKENQIRFLK